MRSRFCTEGGRMASWICFSVLRSVLVLGLFQAMPGQAQSDQQTSSAIDGTQKSEKEFSFPDSPDLAANLTLSGPEINADTWQFVKLVNLDCSFKDSQSTQEQLVAISQMSGVVRRACVFHKEVI
jgi:hypothetical protein